MRTVVAWERQGQLSHLLSCSLSPLFPSPPSLFPSPSPPRQDQRQLKEMNSVRAQRLQKLEARDSDTARAIRWLEENQHQFRQPILEPVCMSLNVLNPRYVKQAEAFFGGRDFMSFVAQNEEDREAFLKAVSCHFLEGGEWQVLDHCAL